MSTVILNSLARARLQSRCLGPPGFSHMSPIIKTNDFHRLTTPSRHKHEVVRRTPLPFYLLYFMCTITRLKNRMEKLLQRTDL